MDDRIETAYHEAGHLVAMALIQCLPRTATIDPGADGMSLGGVTRMREFEETAFLFMESVNSARYSRNKTINYFHWRRAVLAADTATFLAMAGPAAAQIYLDIEDGCRLRTATGTEDDDQSAYIALEVVDVHDESGERKDDIQRWIECFFRDKIVWAAIEHAAKMLLEHGTLNEKATSKLHEHLCSMLDGKTAAIDFEHVYKRNLLPGFDDTFALPNWLNNAADLYLSENKTGDIGTHLSWQ